MRSVRINPATIPPPGSLPVPGQVIEYPVPEPSQADPASRTAPASKSPSSQAPSSGAPIPSRSQSLPPEGALGAPGNAPLPGEDI